MNDKRPHRRLRALLILALLVLLCGGCSPQYYLRAVYEESKILLRRQDITAAAEAADTDPELRRKLKLVLDARSYAQRLRLDPGSSFTKFSKVDKNVLAWVLVAAKPDAFELYHWWFPIVGSVPYKGFFDRESAAAAANSLEQRGYETWIRPTEAFSTLGWFNDPVLSTTLRHDEVRIANTVIHESVHTTLWVPNQVEFNESLANFVGGRGAMEFFRDSVNACLLPEGRPERVSICADPSLLPPLAEQARQQFENELLIGRAVMKLYRALEKLYGSELARAQKLREREAVFARELQPLRSSYPQLKILKQINNAEIIQLKLYLTELDEFAELLDDCSGDWDGFWSRIREAAAAADPFEQLRTRRTP